MTDEPKKPRQKTPAELEIEATVNSLQKAFGLSPRETKQMAAAFKLEKYAALAEVILAPRYAVFGEWFWDRHFKRMVSHNELDSDDKVVADFGYRGNDSPIAPHTLLVRSKAAVHIKGFTSLPGSLDEFVSVRGPQGVMLRMANTWRGSDVMAAPAGSAAPTEFLEHQNWMIGDAGERAWWLDWMAFKLQHPGAYSPLAPYLIGEPGNGKDLTVGLFGQLVGVHNVAKVSMTRLMSPFDDFLIRQYVYVEEMTFGGRQGEDLYDRFKAWTGAPGGSWVELNVKTKAMLLALVQPTMLFTSNSDTALRHVATDDRRLCLVGCDAQRSTRELLPLVALYDDPLYQGRVLRWLLDRDVSNFNASVELRGPSRQRYLINALYDGSAEAFDLVTDGAFATRKAFTFRDVMIQMSQRWHNQAVLAGLERAGVVRLRRATTAGLKDTIYAGATVTGQELAELRSMSTDELKQLIAAEGDAWAVKDD